ncbi:hypothetical protein BDN70DRAFT_901991 [Pholiota conissans]|uniref:Uncharacterized protein n=1 Tax=Pholiota conissans TaxID=109636 RepID=A0A9P5YIM5_9AGAR|nr:hypothetical protein BDN70DRAFT_901991 [Pholiota conissans]
MAHHQDDENQSDEDQQQSAPARVKYTSKVSAKKAVSVQEILEVKRKKIEALEKEMRTLKKTMQSEDGVQEQGAEEELESEEETVLSGFSQSITPTPARHVIQSEDEDDDQGDQEGEKLTGACDPTTSSPQTGTIHKAVDSLTNSHSIEHPFGSHCQQSKSLLLEENESSSRPAPKKTKLTSSSETLQLTPLYCDGIKPDLKKPKASDFIDIIQALIIHTTFKYESLISTKDAFPDTAT